MAEPLYVLADTAVVGHLGTAPLAGLAELPERFETLPADVNIVAAYMREHATVMNGGSSEETEKSSAEESGQSAGGAP